MMITDSEYEHIIGLLISSGRGYKAIRDISYLLECKHKTVEYERDGLETTIKLVDNLTRSKSDSKSKVDTIKKVIEPEEQSVKDRLQRNIIESIRR